MEKKWKTLRERDDFTMRDDVVYKTEIPIPEGRLVVRNDSFGNFVDAIVFDNDNRMISDVPLTPCDVPGRLTLNGLPVTYISPGSVIIAEGSICYTQRCCDGRTITVCWPRGSCPGVG